MNKIYQFEVFQSNWNNSEAAVNYYVRNKVIADLEIEKLIRDGYNAKITISARISCKNNAGV